MSAAPRARDRRLRIGLVTPGFSASETDWCIPAQLDLARVLAARDDLRVFALRYPHARRAYRVYEAEVQAFAAAQRRGPGRLLMWGRVLDALGRAHRRRPFDVLHALWAHEPGFLAVRAGRALGLPVVVSVLGGELVDLAEIGYGGRRTWLNRRLVASALRRATRVTVGSEFLARVARAAGAWDARWSVWPLGVDETRFHPGPRDEARARSRAAGAPLLDGEPACLSVGSLVPVKDQATLLRAFASERPSRPGARLHLVGDGELRPRLETLARELGLAESVRFHGAVVHQLLPDVYRQADLFVISSLFESQCLAALEASACGCAVAGTAVGCLPELRARVVPPGDAASLAGVFSRTTPLPGDAPADNGGAGYRLATAVDRLRDLYAAISPTR